ncbi:MAG: tetratricopeptide repeat protein [Methanosarcinales archaeon]|nr:tetratricopeptide repeat protein [Methanosarcinales archaeon]
MYIDRLEKRGDFAGIFWRKMDESADIADVIGSFFSVIGKPVQDPGNYKIEDMLNLFFHELNAAPYFLVLDNFEILLDPQTNKPNKAGFSDLIEKANGGTGRSRIIFTSWECPASERGIRPNSYTIGGLDDQAAIQLLRNHGLSEPDSELKKAVELSGGHPLALILLVQLVIGEEEPLLSILEDNSLWIGKEGEVAENILDKVYNERVNEKEQEFLQIISLYRLPVPLLAIVMAANDSAWTEARAKKTALTLKRKSLVQKTGDNFWVESIINNYVYSKLDDKVERHKCAYQYYLSLSLPEPRTKKEDVQPLIEAHYHACRAGDYNKALNIIMDNKIHEDLDMWGNSRTLIDLYLDLLPEDHFNDTSLLDNPQSHSIVLGNLGIAYSDLGQVEKAIDYYEQALVIAKEIGDRRGERNCLGNLGNTYSNLGQVKKAIDYYEQALVIAKEIGDRRGEGKHLGNLGNAYRYLGQVKKAIDYYEKALVIAKEIGDKRREGNHLGNLGIAYSDLGQVEKAIEYHEKALVIAKEIGDRRGEGKHLGNLGLAYKYLGQVEKAIEYHEKALVIAKEIDDRRGEGNRLGNLGLAYKYLGQVEKAIDYYEKALVIAKEISERRGEGKHLGNLGNAYSYLGQVEKAIKYYEQALVIGKEIKDPSLINFCEENLKSIKS